MKEVIICSTSGLGNRLKVILSAARIAAVLNRPLSIYWEPKLYSDAYGQPHVYHWGGNWSDWFEYPLQVADLTTDYWNAHSHDHWHKGVLDRSSLPDRLILSGWRLWRFSNEPELDFPTRAPLANGYQELYQYLYVIQPKAELLRRVDDFCWQTGIEPGRWIAVQGRLHHPTSTVQNRRQLLDYAIPLVKARRYTGVFLFTDSQEAHDEMSAILQAADCPFTWLPKSFEFEINLPDGSTLVEMLVVSQAGEIVGSYYSTFPLAAWMYGRSRPKLTLL